MLELRGVRLPMGAREPISFTLETGSIAALIGPSGSGKSLLLAAVARRLQVPGDIRIAGRPLARISGREYPLYIAHSDGNAPGGGNTLYDYLSLARIHHKRFLYPLAEHHLQALESIIDALDLGEYRLTPLATLPSDALRRALMAYSLFRDPELLLLDDPAAGMGIRSLGMAQRALARHTIQGDRTVLFASSDIGFAAQTADRLLIMEGGGIAEDLAPEALDADIIKRYFKTEVLVSRNIYNGRPEVHFFPGA